MEVRTVRVGRIVAGSAAAVIALALAAFFLLPPLRSVRVGGGDYAGSTSCRECHESFYRKWEPSHHGKAMQPVTPQFVRDALSPPTGPISVGGKRYGVDFDRRQVVETAADGKVARYDILHAMGGKNVFYFLTLLDKGRLQVLPVAYNVRDRMWYDTTGSMLRHFVATGDRPLDWRDPMLTFNTACFSCHVSQLAKNYDAATDSYRTVWREPGISLRIVPRSRRAPQPPLAAVSPPAKAEGTGAAELAYLHAGPSEQRLRALPRQDAPGHAGVRSGEGYFDHFDLVCLEDRDFSPDGRDLGENYTYTLWLMNPCARKGKLDCMHCTPPAARYRFAPDVTKDVNAACTSCHADKGRRLLAHTRHPPRGRRAAAFPATCRARSSRHAAQRSLAASAVSRGRDALRLDVGLHPLPQGQDRIVGGLVCEGVASGQPLAAEDSARGRPRRRGAQTRVGAAAGYACLHEGKGCRTRGPAPRCCGCLRGCPEAAAWPAARGCWRIPRRWCAARAAAALADDLRDPATVAALSAALADPVRVVRVQAAQALAAYPRRALDAAAQERLKRAEKELFAMFLARPDDWASHYNMGNYRLAQASRKRPWRPTDTPWPCGPTR
jgi:hypothetical protein